MPHTDPGLQRCSINRTILDCWGLLKCCWNISNNKMKDVYLHLSSSGFSGCERQIFPRSHPSDIDKQLSLPYVISSSTLISSGLFHFLMAWFVIPSVSLSLVYMYPTLPVIPVQCHNSNLQVSYEDDSFSIHLSFPSQLRTLCSFMCP